MASEATEGDGFAPDPATWRGRGVSAVALVGAIILMVLILAVTLTNRSRDTALDVERNTYEVMQLARTVDTSIQRAEASMGRYVLDSTPASATQYYNEWRAAASQIIQLQQLVRADREQTARVIELRRLFNERGAELAWAGRASQRREGIRAISFFYTANQTPTLGAIREKLDEIVRVGRQRLEARVADTRRADVRAERLTRWLGWVAILISLMAVALSYWAYRAFAEGQVARSEADSEAWRASELDRAVQERTRELSAANAQLQAEIGERAAAEEKLRQVQKMEAVGQLTGGIAHDFNNMLAVVVGGLDLAKRRLRRDPREVEMHIDNAMEGATRAAALTRRLLAFARAEPLMPEGVAPSALVENMLELIDRTIGERITVHTRLASGAWHVFADPSGLESALINLCVNARDAMEENGELILSVENVRLGAGQIGALAAGDYVRIGVADSGRGIAPEHLERVFEPFFTTKPVGKGTGLGLSQVFGFARQSGGDLTIQSRLGEGTVVAIYLPRVEGGEERAPRRVEPAAAEPEPRGRGGARILVVEDDPRVSRATVTALEELGHQPSAVASGAEALQALSGGGGGYQLIVSDVVMPAMTGVELAREVGRSYPHLPVLFVTGYVGEAGTVEELGEHVLRKPFTVAQLAQAVARVLQPREAFGAAAE